MSLSRRDFMALVVGGISYAAPACSWPQRTREIDADIVVAGGGLGAIAASLAALRAGLRVVLTEETDWIGGQLTQQGVPPDEHRWIEQLGATRSYHRLREMIRAKYRQHSPLTKAAREMVVLNPGRCFVSRLCHEPHVAHAVLEDLLRPYIATGSCQILMQTHIMRAEMRGDRVQAVIAKHIPTGMEVALIAPFFVDATELGDLLPLTGTEHVIGAEAQSLTGEAHAASQPDPLNQQAFTHCFAMQYLKGEIHTIEKPRDWAFWRDYVPKLMPPWPGRLLDFTYTQPRTMKPIRLPFDPDLGSPGNLDLWNYRRMIDRRLFAPGTYAGDITLVNWPQNDYTVGPLLGVPGEIRRRHIEGARQLSLSLLYWLQTEAPRVEGGYGFPELRLRGDVLGTSDGLAKFPYIRESRRIQALFTVVEHHVSKEERGRLSDPSVAMHGEHFEDSVGIGSYNIDLHPSSGGDNYIDIATSPFELPLGALIPCRVENLLAGAKNIGTTHITNGCYRLHPMEWNIGEVAGLLVAFCLKKAITPARVRSKKDLLGTFQRILVDNGIETRWPDWRQ